MRYLTFIGFLATIPAANWLIGNVGTCVTSGPCVIQVWPGIMAPSGVLMIGLAFVLRDALHEIWGVKAVLAAIVLGALASTVLAPQMLAIASGTAFLLSELADLFVYTPLRRRSLMQAVFWSSIAGAVVDSALFLWLAFGSLDFLAGQIIGKAWMVMLACGLMYAYRVTPGSGGEPRG